MSHLKKIFTALKNSWKAVYLFSSIFVLILLKINWQTIKEFLRVQLIGSRWVRSGSIRISIPPREIYDLFLTTPLAFYNIMLVLILILSVVFLILINIKNLNKGEKR